MNDTKGLSGDPERVCRKKSEAFLSPQLHFVHRNRDSIVRSIRLVHPVFQPSDPMAPRQELCGSVKVDRAASDIGQERANSREMVEVIPSSTDGQYLF